ncbi:uncharacterized protein K460DRAFT_369518 [Cucurbitaria berberidis CBS 394.84]|uniref:Rrn9 domain-containing protein n=1 Tax=Cucurbitaria berberidis CBS 394.84 TaxID=1168544 RepID=A0A9P4G9H2_9PLEO|nr:uncharacterized protein K460DRAFT_369518 [Cucurbitaria berberidis CBS 394.84]KAF1841485.1 hypothetical protein K460DRAFT_369518 [Cucurbitaria berberidis CBS 394.84]
MSLFGGDGSAPPTESPQESEPDNSQPSIRQSFPAIAEPASPPSAQFAPNVQPPLESEVRNDLSTDSETELNEFDQDRPSRPNRFTGPPQTWKGYTAVDRQIAASLDQIRDSDLAAHLYNAHALKRRAQRPKEEIAQLENWQGRDNWSKTGSDLQYTDVSGILQTELVPSKDWTAWPLPPARLPHAHDRLRRGLADGDPKQWMIGGARTQDVGEELRGELLAVFLRLAKERWESRETEDVDQRSRDRTMISPSRSRSKSVMSTKSRRSTSRVDVEMKDGDNLENDNDEAQDDDDDEEHLGLVVGKKRGRKSQTETYARPSVLADDAKAQRLLQPTINSVLSNLDDIALAVRRTRLNHFGHGGSSDRSSMSEFTSGVESGGSRSSTRSRSKSATSRKESTQPSYRATSTRASRTAKEGKSTSKPPTELLDNDLASSSASDSDAAKSTSYKRKRRRSASITSDNSASTNRDWSGRAGLLDWSEVLGLAAVKGWDKGALARTAHRCAAVFGESMSFLPFDESLASKPIAEPVYYIPSTLPAPELLPISGPSSFKRPFFQVGTLRCPHTDCYGHEKDFALPYRVVEHCKRMHGYDPRTNDSDNEERTIGAVHMDGFLHPVTLKPGWLGHGRSKASTASKKQKMGEEESPDPLDVVESIDEPQTY